MKPPEKLKRGPAWLKKAHNDLLGFSIRSRPLRTDTCEIDEVADGTRILPKIMTEGGSSTASPTSHPFKVVTRTNPENPNQWQARVIANSFLFLSLRPNDWYGQEGGSASAIDNIDEWFNLNANDAIWLGVVFDTTYPFAPNDVGINSWGRGDSFNITEEPWSGNQGVIEDDDEDVPVHQTTRKLIAYTIAGEDGQPVLHQLVRSHLLIRDAAIDGRTYQGIIEYAGGYPL